MARPMFRIHFAGDEADFQLQILSPGKTLLDRWNTHCQMIREWLGRFYAEPVWDGESVEFFARDDQQRQLVDIVSEPATSADLRGPLKAEFDELKQRLTNAQPTSATGVAVRDFLVRGLIDPSPGDDGVAAQCQFHKYQDVAGRWRLVWCCGFIPARQRNDARPFVCGNPECRRLVMRHPTSPPACAACQHPFSNAARGRARRGLIPLLVLLLAAATAAAGVFVWRLPNAMIEGRVVQGEDARPVAGAEVAIEGTSLTARTDSAGAFQIAKAPQGLVEIVARAAGFQEGRSQVELVRFRKSSVELTLRGAAHVTGRVVRRDGENDSPIPGARVRIKDTDHEPLAADEEGRFQLSGLAPGPVALEIAAEGFLAADVEAIASGTLSEPLRIVLTGGGGLTGRVVYAAQPTQPIADAEVALGGLDAARTRVDSNGQFRLTGVAPGEVQISASAPGFEPLVVAVQAGSPALTLALQGDATVAGVVVRGDTNQPQPDAEVWIPGTPFKTRADARGEFRIEGARSGATRVSAMGKGMSGSMNSTLPSRRETSVRIVLTGDKAIAGRVFNALDKQPVAGAKVTLEEINRDVLTDEQGRFALDGLAGARIKLRIEAEGYFPGAADAELMTEKQRMDDIGLRPIAKVDGTVLRSLDQKPLEGAVVSLAGAPEKVRTDAAGRFALLRVPAGPAALTIAAEGYQSLTIKPALTAGRQQLDAVALEGDAYAAGVTLDAADENRAVPNVILEVSVAGTQKKLTTAANGGFKLGYLPPGIIRVKATAAGFLDTSIERRIQADDAWIKLPMVRLVNTPGVVIESAKGANGKKRPIAKADIVLRSAAGVHRATSGNDGGFVAANVAAGPVQATVKAPGYLETTLDLHVNAGTPWLEIPLAALVEVRGVVVDLANPRVAVPRADIEIMAGGAVIRATTGDRGAFQALVPPGRASLRVRAEGYAETVVEKEITAADAAVEVRVPRGLTIRGQVINAVNNVPVPYARIAVGGTGRFDAASSDDKGLFTLAGVPLNSPQLEISASGFETAQVEPIPTDGSPLRIMLSPDLPPGEMRLILTWGARPLDLDGHLFGPLPDGSRFHVDFEERAVQGANLDVDAKKGFGPETITLRASPGTYQFFVADAANVGTGDGAKLATSLARVQVYYKDAKTKSQIFTLPRNAAAPVWHALDIVVDEVGKITLSPPNRFSRDIPAK